MKTMLNLRLGGWETPRTEELPMPTQDIPPYSVAGNVYFIDKPGAKQAAVTIAEPGIALTDPSTYALDMFGSTLNGFGGTLLLTSYLSSKSCIFVVYG